MVANTQLQLNNAVLDYISNQWKNPPPPPPKKEMVHRPDL